MPSYKNTPILLYDSDGFADLHLEIAAAFQHGLKKIGDLLSVVTNDERTDMVFNALLTDLLSSSTRQLLHQLGWREFLQNGPIDFISMTALWRTAAEYAGQGLAPAELQRLEEEPEPPSIEGREKKIRRLIDQVRIIREGAVRIIGLQYDYIFEGCLARAALDFGGTLTLGGLQILSRLSLSAIRTAISTGELHPDSDERVAADEARAWLARRREFCPSRWCNPLDNQWPFDPKKVTESNDGLIHVPQDSEGTSFLPEHVVRRQKSGAGPSIFIGPKGHEQQFDDYYDALQALATMDVARWRRRNAAGNWGIVRARGAWVAANRADIDRQLAEKLGDGR